MPRPIERIDPMRRAWEKYPRDPNRPAARDYRDPFDVEDDEMWAGLERLAALLPVL